MPSEVRQFPHRGGCLRFGIARAIIYVTLSHARSVKETSRLIQTLTSLVSLSQMNYLLSDDNQLKNRHGFVFIMCLICVQNDLCSLVHYTFLKHFLFAIIYVTCWLDAAKMPA